jgi:phage terminase large subunit GpA-like protein
MCGSNSVTDASGKSVRVFSADEVDRFEVSSEGDIVDIAMKRMGTAHNWLMMITATPKDDGTSTVQKWWNLSDKRKYFVPCPKCEHKQTLYWSKETVTWDHTEDGEHIPETARYVCEHCHAELYDDDINEMVKKGEWIATAPFKGIAGFGELPEFYAPWKKLRETARDFLNAKDDPDKLRVWVNTALGQPWKEPGEALEVADIYELCEEYDPVVPAGAGIVTAFVDTQDDRLEVLTKAWGRGEESWALEYRVFHGDTSIIPESLSMPGQQNLFDRQDTEDNPWFQMDQFLAKTYPHQSGVQIPIAITGIDTGGHRADQVYTYVKLRQGRGVRGTKGDTNPFKAPISPPSTSARSKAGKKYKIKLFMIGTQTLKDTISARLRHTLKKDPGERSGIAVYHYPRHFPYEFFEQLTAEKKVKRKVGGRYIKVWENVKKARNEALDLEVGNLAVLKMKCPNAQALADRCEMYDKYLKTNVNTIPKQENPPVVAYAPAKKARRVISSGVQI